MWSKEFNFLLWHVKVRRGGTATPWPWTDINVSRRWSKRRADRWAKQRRRNG